MICVCHDYYKDNIYFKMDFENQILKKKKKITVSFSFEFVLHQWRCGILEEGENLK